MLLVAATPLLANAAAKAPVCPKTQALYFERSAPFKGVDDTSVFDFIYIKNLSSTATITPIITIQHILHSLQTSGIKCDPDWHKHEVSHERPQG